MRYCPCGHPDSLHAEDGTGTCLGVNRKGDPCSCERFQGKPEEALTEIPPIPAHAQRWIEGLVRGLIQKFIAKNGALPERVYVSCIGGFEIYWALEFVDGAWIYLSTKPVELAGAPGQTWRIAP